MQNFNIKNSIRPNIATMKPYSSARDEFTDFEQNMVFLDANENPFNTEVNRYPDPHQVTLKTHLSTLKKVPIDQILLGNGSDEVLDLIMRAFCEPGQDNMITLPPTYGMYSVLAQTNNIENREVVLNDAFQPNIDVILKQIDAHTKIIFLCSPNNPTANLFDKKIIQKLLERFNGLIMIDEAYIDFAQGESWTAQLHDHPNLIISQTLSKAYGMAGIRLGICYASTDIISVLNKIKPPYNVNELTQKRALKRVLHPEDVENEINMILRQRKLLAKALEDIDFVQKVFPSEANFILARVDDADLRYKQLINNGIVVRNRSNQALCENTLRFTVGTEEENKKLIAILRLISKS